jgi:Protein of unknown function (DUF3108)
VTLFRSASLKVATAVALAVLFAPFLAYSEPPDPPAMMPPADPEAPVHRLVPNSAFGVGERLVFSVEFLGFSAGSATLEIPEVVDVGRAKAFRLISESRTNSFFDKLYPVRNRYESFIDTESLCSLRYVENQQERGALRDRISDFDPEKGTASVTRFPVQKRGKPLNTAPAKTEQVPIPRFVQDVLSGLYFLRTQDLRVGGEYRVPTISGVKTYELIVHVPRRKTIRTPIGTFQTLELIPELKYDGLFINKGTSYVYVTDDALKMPVLLKSKIAIGSFRAVLTEKHRSDLVTETEATPSPGT